MLPDMFCAALRSVIVVSSGGLAAAVARVVADSVASAAKGTSDRCPEALSKRLLPREGREENCAELEVLEGVDDNIDGRVDSEQEMIDPDQDNNPDWRRRQLSKRNKLKRQNDRI